MRQRLVEDEEKAAQERYDRTSMEEKIVYRQHKRDMIGPSQKIVYRQRKALRMKIREEQDGSEGQL